MAFGLLAGCGVAGALATPSQVDEEDRRAAAWIRHQIDSGAIGDDGHVLVSYWLPEATALYVLSNRMDRVHLDAMGARCSVQFLLPFAPTCPLPEWGERVQIVIARKSSLEEDYIRSQKWRPVKDFGVWAAYRRPAGTVFPQERNKAPDPMFLR